MTAIPPYEQARLEREQLAAKMPTREQAAAKLAERGLHPGADGKPTYAPLAHPETAYPNNGPVTPATLAKMSLPPDLARVVLDDMTAHPEDKVDPEQVAATYRYSTASTYAGDLEAAAALLAHAGSQLRADRLPASALRNLAIWARHVSSRGSK